MFERERGGRVVYWLNGLQTTLEVEIICVCMCMCVFVEEEGNY